jgi:hypothetical protein
VGDDGELVATTTLSVDTERGRPELPRDALAPGWYRVALADRSGESIASNDFWVLDPDAVPSVAVDGASFAEGDPLPIRWENGPGNRNDWIGIFDANVFGDDQDILTYAYVGARCFGALTMAASTTEGGWPIPAGRYVARLLKDDGYEVLAESSPFTVE